MRVIKKKQPNINILPFPISYQSADVLASRAHIYYREFLQNTLHGFRLIENQQYNIVTSFSFIGYAKNDLYTFKFGQVGN